MDQQPTTQDYWPRAHWPGFVARDDHQFQISIWNAAAGVTLTLAGVIGGPDGVARPFAYQIVPTTARALFQQRFPFEAGVLLCAEVFSSAGTPLASQCYVRLEMVHGQSSAFTSVGTILAGYVTANSARTYPNDQVTRSIDGRGTFRIVQGTVPAAGADFSDTVPTNTRWQLQAVAFTLTPSAAVANRVPILTIDDGANIIWETSNNANVVASTTTKFRAGAGAQLSTITANDFILPLAEPLVLPAGSRIRSVTTGIQAADQYSAIFYNVEEWLDV